MKQLRSNFFLMFIIFSFNMKSQDSLYNVAAYLHKAYNLEKENDEYLFNKIEKYYKLALNVDSNHVNSIYGLGILYYNNAAVYGTKLKKDTGALADKDIKMIDMYMKKAKLYLDKYSKVSGRKVKFE